MSDASNRRRWVTFAEIVAVIGLVISGVGVWLSWSDHRAQEAERTTAARDKSVVTLQGDPDRGGAVLRLSDPAHPVQRIEVRFPAALGVAAHTGEGQPRVKAEWFDHALLKATDAHHGRLPVLITAFYWDGTIERHDTAIYDIVWQSSGRLFRGRTLRLDGIALRERTTRPARLDALWKAGKG